MPAELIASAPRRVFMTTDAVGGVWSYSLDLARGLADAGIEIFLAVLGPPPAQEQLDLVPARVRLQITNLPLDWTAANYVALDETCNALANMATEIRADTVHLHSPALVGKVVWHRPVIAVAHSCVGTWWRTVRSDAFSRDMCWRHDATGRGLRRADMVIAPSQSFADALLAVHGGGFTVRVIYNGRCMPAVQSRPTGDRMVLTAGRLWDEGKNIALLDECARWIDAPIVAAGPLARPDGVVRSFPHLHTTGLQSEAEMRRHYARAWLFVSTALYEPFGLTVLEAAQAGLPLVLSDIPSFRELWDGAAVFCRPRDAWAFISAINDLLRDSDRRAALTAESRARAGRYTTEAMVSATLAVHRHALSGRTAQAA